MIARLLIRSNGRTTGSQPDFLRDRRGVTAVEFGLVGLPFLLLLVGIIETGLTFFINQSLDNAVLQATRLIRTGQAKAQGFDADAFKAEIMNQFDYLPVSVDRLSVDVEVLPNFGSYSPKPLIKDGKLVDDFGYDHGNAGEIVIVRALYRWPMLTNFFKMEYGDLDDGSRALVSTAVFRNEPFPW